MAERYALLIGTSEYNDEKLARLKTPVTDLDVLAGLLRNESIGGYQVKALLNQPFLTLRTEIVSFMKDKSRDDLLLLYFSGHGVRDEGGNLYLATKETQTSVLSAAALESWFITDQMDRSRSRRQVLILDCCYAGAFLKGTKGAGHALIQETFEGYGRAVLTATDSVQNALEGDQVSEDLQLSLFTHFLTEGIRTGDADQDSDGWIELDEWFDYASRKVRERTHLQTPHKNVATEGDLFIARSPKAGAIRSGELSQKLRARLKSEYKPDRQEAVEDLKRLLESDDEATALAALSALEKVAERDDSNSIRRKASEVLADAGDQVAALKVKTESQSKERTRAEEERRDREQAARKAEEERLERERKEQARLAAEKAEVERQAALKAEEERLARERKEQARLAAEKAEAERQAKEKAKAERLAREREKQAKLAAQKAEEERLAKERDDQTHRATPVTWATGAIKLDPKKSRSKVFFTVPKAVFKAPILQATLSDHKETVSCLAFSPDGSRLASGSLPSDQPILGDQTIRIWRVTDGAPLAKVSHRKGVYALVFSGDQNRLASFGEDGWVHVWGSPDYKLVWKEKMDQYAGPRAMTSPDGSSLATVDEQHVHVRRFADGRILKDYTLENFSSSSLARNKPAISADGSIVAVVNQPFRLLSSTPSPWSSVDPDPDVQVWHLADGKKIGAFKLALTPEAGTKSSTTWIGSGQVGTGFTQPQSVKPEMRKPRVGCYVLSSDGKILAVALENAQVLLVSIPDGRQLRVLGTSAGLSSSFAFLSRIRHLAFSPGGEFLAVTMEGELRYWGVPGGDLLLSQKVEYQPHLCIFSKNGKLFANSTGNNITIWSFPS